MLPALGGGGPAREQLGARKADTHTAGVIKGLGSEPWEGRAALSD